MNDAYIGYSGTSGSLPVIFALGTAQTIAWASSYYLPAILAVPIARDLGMAPTFVFGALSGALVITGLLGPRVGHAIDTFGGRGLLAISNGILATGLLLLSFAGGAIGLIAAWIILGVGMGMGLYESAFATLTRIYGTAARKPITGITLIAGFASTVGWPLSTWLDTEFSWRFACQVWALIHLILALPLNLALPRARILQQAETKPEGSPATKRSESFTMVALAYVFAATGFVSSGLSALLPSMLVQFGATPAAALFAGALVGPSQVAARIFEAGWLAHYHPLISARLATLMTPSRRDRARLWRTAVRPCFCGILRSGQRYPYDRAWHATACVIWAARLWSSGGVPFASRASHWCARTARSWADGGVYRHWRTLGQRARFDFGICRVASFEVGSRGMSGATAPFSLRARRFVWPAVGVQVLVQIGAFGSSASIAAILP